MQHACLLDQVRETVRATFTAQGLSSLEDFCETILIRDGFYCGRSFTCGGLRAVWFVEENVLKFFSQSSGLLFSQPACPDEQTRRVIAA